MSTINCAVRCPYCKEAQLIETGRIQDNLDFTAESNRGDACNDTVEIDDLVTCCVKCDRRFVISVDLTIDVIEFGIIGEAEKPGGSGLQGVSPGSS